MFHLAAQAPVGVAAQNPAATFDSNIRGTWTLLDACRVVGGGRSRSWSPRRIRPTASTPASLIREDACLLAFLSLRRQQGLRRSDRPSYATSYALPVAVTRLGNIYGPGDLNFTRLVPDSIRCAFAGRPVVLRSDGTMRRDYVYVGDAVDAYLRLAARLADGTPGVAGTAFNFGAARPTKVLDVVAAVRRLFPGAPEPQVLGTAAGEIPAQSLDWSRAEETLGWRPAHDLDEGLAPTAAWYSALFAGIPLS